MELATVLSRIEAPRLAYASAIEICSSAPGLYAFYGGAEVWETLGLGQPPDNRPLYLGKSQKSLRRRPLGDHFGERSTARATSPTGSSSPRRSLAALLRVPLALHACPRNPESPGYFDRYGLDREADFHLTKWMRDHLLISFCSVEEPCDLHRLEEAAAQALEPPLYLDSVFSEQHQRWVALATAARRVMAQQARNWCKDIDNRISDA